MSGLIKFTGGITAIPENASAFIGMQVSPNGGDSMVISVTPDISNSANPSAPAGQYTIMGGNKSANQVDMFPVKDESLNAGALGTGTPFVKMFWPFKYIGIFYEPNGDSGAGTMSFWLEERVLRTNLI